ncbi:uncharacterized protein RCC_02127 [Ramularia collo-cygni]|uniref:Uncharacterized protein n=1 Tax=Ramularia collo-cygni TaxID=112498 RepID=A0A2D3URS1_9PEZI|nr:uncharacterized protein RCC_02127 [Ramularia collo-cygni]CZT16285.1 uncharacterized protein RCC_02127 [Ramularia collo-cygni]
MTKNNTVTVPSAKLSPTIPRHNGEIVYLLVGNNVLNAVTLYEKLLKSDSPVLREALKLAHEERRNALAVRLLGSKLNLTISLPNDDHHIVQRWATWHNDHRAALDEEDQNLLSRMFLFGESIGGVDFCQAILKRMAARAKSGCISDAETVFMVYERTAAGSLIRQFLVDAWVARAPSSWLENTGDGVRHQEFNQQLILALARRCRGLSRWRDWLLGLSSLLICFLFVQLCLHWTGLGRIPPWPVRTISVQPEEVASLWSRIFPR